MLSINKWISMLVLITIVLFLPISASATVPFSSGYKGPGQAVFVVMHYEDASPIGEIQAKLEQDMAALEQAFAKLQSDGILDPDFPRLVIVASKLYKEDYRFEIAPTLLSLTNSAVLICNNPDTPQFAPEDLGPAYVIKTSTGLLSFNDLAVMMIHLGGLNETTPLITIENEEKLLAARIHPVFEEITNLRVKKDEKDITSGGLRISALWDRGKTQYSLIDEAGITTTELEPVDVYIGRPSWPPTGRNDMQGRLIAYASKDQAIIYDIVNGKYHILNLDFEYKDADAKQAAAYMEYQRVEFAMHAKENKVYVLPFGRMGMIIIAYSLDLDSGKWVRELEDALISDEVWGNRFNGIWIDFVPAITSRRIKNIDILTSEEEIANRTTNYGLDSVNIDQIKVPTDEQPTKDRPADETAAYEEAARGTEESAGQTNFDRALWLLLLIFPAAAIIFLARNWRKP